MLIELTRKVDKFAKVSEEEIGERFGRIRNAEDQREFQRICIFSQQDFRNNLNVEPYILNTNRITDICRYHFSQRDEYWKEGAKTVLRIGKTTVYIAESVEEIATLSKTRKIRSALT